MGEKVLSLGAFLTTTIISFFLVDIRPVIASECQFDSIQTTSSLPISLHTSQTPLNSKISNGIAYATGDCREECRGWGNSVNQQNGERLYKSYHYIAWDSGLRICTVSSEYKDFCPPVGAGTSECNY